MEPNSWSLQKTEEFDVSVEMVRTARKLKEEMGILSIPEKKRGKILSPEILNCCYHNSSSKFL